MTTLTEPPVYVDFDNQEPVAPNERRQTSQKGGLRGGPARAKSISPARRSEIARKASQARWALKNKLTPVG